MLEIQGLSAGYGESLVLREIDLSVAAIANTSLALGLWLVGPILIGLLAQAMRVDSDTFEIFGFMVIGTQPLPLIVGAVEGAVNASTWGRVEYSMPWLDDMDVVGFTALLGVVSAAYAGLGAMAMAYACARFNRLAGRSS